MRQTSLLELLTPSSPLARSEPVSDRPDGVPGWIPVWEPPWPPAPWEAAAFDSPFLDEPSVQGWAARWPDGAAAQVRPWEDGRWWWEATIGQSREARTLAGSPRDAVWAADAWLAETLAGIARGDWA